MRLNQWAMLAGVLTTLGCARPWVTEADDAPAIDREQAPKGPALDGSTTTQGVPAFEDSRVRLRRKLVP